MHEMSIAQSVLDIVKEEMVRHSVEKLSAINIAVGKMAAVVPEHLNMCFKILTDGTDLADVPLVVREVPLTYRCHECDATNSSEELIFKCPECDAENPEMIKGKELTIENIEVAE